IASGGQHLYSVDAVGNINRGEYHNDKVKWATIAKEEVESFTIYNGDIIFSDPEDRLWKIPLKKVSSGKVQIGRYNDIIYTEKIKQMIARDALIYVIYSNRNLLYGKH